MSFERAQQDYDSEIPEDQHLANPDLEDEEAPPERDDLDEWEFFDGYYEDPDEERERDE